MKQEVSKMDKRMITKWWIWGLVAMIPGGILIPASIAALAAHLETVTIVTPGNWANFVPDDYSWTMVILIVLGSIFAGAGIIAQLVSWIGAVLNTRRLADRRWFNALLWGGIVGIVTTPLFGLGALIAGGLMIAYLVGGPDEMAREQPPESAASPQAPKQPMQPTMLSKQTIKKWTTWGWVAIVAGGFFPLLVANATDPGRFLNGLVWPSLALEGLGFTVAVCGLIAEFAAWWGALFNAHRLAADKTWFNLLLWGGIVGAVTMPLFGLGALIAGGVMIVYLVGGPDGLAAQVQKPQATPAAPPTTLAPTS
jgi:hypothetical protein